MRIAVVLPSRGRPAMAAQAIDSVRATRAAHTRVILVPDLEDPALPDYRDLGMTIEARGNMVERTNTAALLTAEEFDVIGWMADDNRFRTPGWDIRVTKRFAKPGVGFVALNDLFWAERDKPVNVFVRSSIIRALGWFANPRMVHHYMDDTWRVLGESTDSYDYLPDVICEHLHPAVGKGVWDDQYVEHETQEVYLAEGRRFIDWIQQDFVRDRRKVMACLGS